MKSLSFKVIAFLLPFLALGLLELSLRMCHYGYDASLFITDPADSRYLVLNPDASRSYFSNQVNATTGNLEPFKKEKDPGTFRVFVLGESTTIGYPYLHNGSFHRWLAYRLMHTFPDKNLEIINLSLTAVNSYTVLGFAREVVHYAPDAVLIYAGHNEYYGALGVGSTDRIGGNAFLVGSVLWLRQFRVMQLMTNTYDGIVGLFGSHADPGGKTRMEMMVGSGRIPYGSPLYERGIAQFKKNMDETLDLFDRTHIPVFISNLVSNEKDLPPFVSAEAGSPAFKRDFDLGLGDLRAGDSTGAFTAFLGADSAFPGHALCNYYLGRIAYGRGDYAGAKAWFRKASSLDELRFRGPDTLNTIIAGLSQAHHNVHLVDTRAAFEAASDHGIIGDEVLLEHVHPNLFGYALLSDVFYTSMKDAGLFTVPPGAEVSFMELRRTMPVTKTDSLIGAYKILNLKSYWPFSGGQARDSIRASSEEEELAFNVAFRHMPWEQSMSNLYDYYTREQDLRDAGLVMEGLVLEHPTEEAYYEKAANLYGQLKDYDRAIFYFKKAFAFSPSFDKARYIFVMDLAMDRPGDALSYLDYAIANNTSGTNLGAVKDYTRQVVELERVSGKDTSNLAVLNQIAEAYSRMGNKEAAGIYYAKILKQSNGKAGH